MSTDRPGDAGQAAALTRGSTAGVGLAGAAAAGAGLAILLITAKVLDEAHNADFLAFWAMLFAVLGVLGGIQNETTRAVRARANGGGAAGGAGGVRTVPLALAVGAGLAAVLAATSPWWSGPVFGGHDDVGLVALLAATVAFAGHAAVAGSLAGLGRWHTYSSLVAAEAVARLLLVVAVAVVGATVAGLEVAAPAAPGAWLILLLVSRTGRLALTARSDVPARPFLRQTGQAMLAAACSAAIIVGFPVLLRLTSSEAVYDASAPLLVAVSLTRAPLMVPLGAYQGVAITHFLAHRDRGLAALRPLAGAILGVGLAGAGLAALVGPWLMTLVRDTYHVDGLVLAGLTFDAALLALLTLTGAAVLAVGRHTAYAVGWVAASVVSLVVLLLPLPVDARAVASLAAGPLAGLLVHVGTLRLVRPAPVAPDAAR